ncbi:MAG: shikimate dehydrogenase [Polaromonas sp.]|nr:shikimate dehydrogenase [Polaromonas sp.]
MFPSINGATDVYLILGDPVEQVRAPEVFNLVFRALGMDAVMVPVQVPAASVRDFMRAIFSARNIKGLLLTIPHKSLVMDLLGDCSALGRLAGAVNAVRCDAQGRLAGALFDGEGLVSSLNAFNISYTGKRVLILGAGGGAAAIAASLVSPASTASKGAAAQVALFDPTPGKARALAQRLGASSAARVVAVASADPTGFDLVLNASPLGLQAADPMPCDVSRMAPHAALVDILMKNQPTPVVRAARARGLVAHPGFEMLIQQMHLYLDFFGLPDAALAVRRDADFVRRAIYPAELQRDIDLFLTTRGDNNEKTIRS